MVKLGYVICILEIQQNTVQITGIKYSSSPGVYQVIKDLKRLCIFNDIQLHGFLSAVHRERNSISTNFQLA